MMNSNFFRRTAFAIALVSLLCSLVASSNLVAAGTQREHLTAEEIEQVRDNQELDKRIGVFIKAVERRLQVINGQTPALSKKAEKEAAKDAELYGALPQGTRAQLLSDIANILDEAITNIDDAAIHSEKSPLIPKALRKLAEASERFMPQFVALRDKAQEGAERDWLERSYENAQSIVQAAKKLPEETKKK